MDSDSFASFEDGLDIAFQKLSPALGQRAFLGGARRLSSGQAPESHPVSPASSEREVDGVAAAASTLTREKRGAGPASPATSHFSIPAHRCEAHSAASPKPAAAAAEAEAKAVPRVAAPVVTAWQEERVTLNLFIQEEQLGEVDRLQREVSSLRSCLDRLQTQRGQEQPAAAPAAAAAAGGDAAAQQAAAAARVLPVQLVLKILEPSAEQQQQQQAVAAVDEAGCALLPLGAAKQATLQQQLQRVEACREELARQAGQLRGQVAKLEGAVLAGECRVRAQAAELAALRASCRDTEQQLAAAQAQVGVTPDRTRREVRRLAELAVEARAAADAQAARAERLAAVLAYEAREGAEVADFAAVEHQLLADREQALAAEAAQWRADAGAAAAQLADARRRLVEADAALLQRDDEARGLYRCFWQALAALLATWPGCGGPCHGGSQSTGERPGLQVKQARGELAAAAEAAAVAAALTADWRQRAELYDRDRQAAAANIRKAERELELVAQDNERMFRQLNFVRTRLIGQLAGLDPAVPDIGKLARELQSWCDREAAMRGRLKA